MEGGDRLDLDQEIRVRGQRHLVHGAARRFGAEIARQHIGVLFEPVHVSDVGPRQEDGRTFAPAASRQAWIVLPTCSICARISPLPTTFPCLSTATCPPTRRRRPPSLNEITTEGGRPRHGGPTIAGSAWVFTVNQFSLPVPILAAAFWRHVSSERVVWVRYSLPSTIAQAWGSTVSLCGSLGDAHGAITVVLRRVFRILDEQIVMGSAGKAPARIVHTYSNSLTPGTGFPSVK